MKDEFIKLTEEKIDELSETQELRKYLVKKVKDTYDSVTNNNKFEFEYCLKDCESPIEQMLALCLQELYLLNEFDIPLLIDCVAIDNQVEIEVNDKKNRVDFLIFVKYWNCNKCFVIECDGHEFHQKTKEQVERDNERTRDLQLAGYEVIRFSGTEIYHRPHQCARMIKK